MLPIRTRPRLTFPPWAGSVLTERFGKSDDPSVRVGESWEVWGDNPTAEGRPLREVADLPLLIKLVDVGERLSVQVHPDDASARRIDASPIGKSEGWVVLHAEPGARAAIGLARQMRPEELRESALSGAIEADLAWRPIAAGDVIDVPAGTVHTIDGRVLLYEVQQPSDLTYRLYDWGRGRPLRLADAVAVARLRPSAPTAPPRPLGPGRELLLDTPKFSVERRRAGVHRSAGWEAITVVEGALWVGDDRLLAGESAVLAPGDWPVRGDGEALVARPNPASGRATATASGRRERPFLAKGAAGV